MSIITDNKISKFNSRIYLLYVLVVCLGVFIANILFNLCIRIPKVDRHNIATKDQTRINKIQPLNVLQELPEKKLPEKETPLESEETTPVVVSKFKGELVLTGVFFSQDGGYALINNRVVKEGNVIEGAIVKRITLDKVELESEGSTIELSITK